MWGPCCPTVWVLGSWLVVPLLVSNMCRGMTRRGWFVEFVSVVSLDHSGCSLWCVVCYCCFFPVVVFAGTREFTVFVCCADWVRACEFASAVFQVPFCTCWFEWVRGCVGVCVGRCVVYVVVAAAALIGVVYVCVSVGVVNVILPSEVWPFPPVWAAFVCVSSCVEVVVSGSVVVLPVG